ncbi:glycosyltransferase family 4 protein [Actinomadura rupiterrae]|uniref:glycosyltransferase family 4 protein n=1 Tax=Actinomadura rupiterrae TaxID=559627 RepID=UPI0020A4AE05|nr:glycosyltransferase family 4 protein [Actinomadura rupiterrae]MCP2335142.1 glycosyltransferase involved in cell wall biosynthesis [Actinomadura rupiterrae]
MKAGQNKGPAEVDGGVDGLRVAVVNWRDPWHPAAGGAEVYAWELARRFAERGAEVTYVTCRAPGQARRERVDGVRFVRLGGRFTVYPLVLAWMLAHRRRFDAVLDCQNGIPFFTPWVLPRRVPVFCAIFHVHDEQFGLYFPPWLAWIGRTLEGPVARRTYRRHACTAISPTTVEALRTRLAWTGPVYLVPVGVDTPKDDPAPRRAPDPSAPRLVCVTRLVPHKRADLLLDVVERVLPERPGLRLRIIGRGPEQDRLAAEIAARGLGGAVELLGFVPEDEKAAVVADADLHLSASRGEGWGLVVAEAAALGVPTIAYDVDGLRDAVRDGTTGWLAADTGDADELVHTLDLALKELADPARRDAVAAACRAWAAEFDWKRTADRMGELVAASRRRGSSGTRGTAVPGADAHVVRRYGDGHLRVAEGPVRDELLDAGEAEPVRPATPLERLLGRVEDTGGGAAAEPAGR